MELRINELRMNTLPFTIKYIFCVVLHSSSFYHILAHSTTFQHIPPHSGTFHHILAHSTTFWHIPPHSGSFHHIPPHSTTFYHIVAFSSILNKKKGQLDQSLTNELRINELFMSLGAISCLGHFMSEPFQVQLSHFMSRPFHVEPFHVRAISC